MVLGPAIEAGWCHPDTPAAPRGIGRPEIFTDRAIETMLQLKLAFGLSYSGVVGLVRDYFESHHIPRPVPTEATLCRRIQQMGARALATRVPRLGLALLLGPAPARPYGVLIDSTGFSIRGAGSWRTNRPGREPHLTQRRLWVKVHWAYDPVAARIVALGISLSSVGDGQVGARLLRTLRAAGHQVTHVAADGAYDNQPFYGAAVSIGVTHLLVPPRRDAGLWPDEGREAIPGAALRNAHWGQVHHTDPGERSRLRAAWKKRIGYHVRSLIETLMSRSATLCGNRCRMRSVPGRLAEIVAVTQLLNHRAALGQPIRQARDWLETWVPAPA